MNWHKRFTSDLTLILKIKHADYFSAQFSQTNEISVL